MAGEKSAQLTWDSNKPQLLNNADTTTQIQLLKAPFIATQLNSTQLNSTGRRVKLCRYKLGLTTQIQQCRYSWWAMQIQQHRYSCSAMHSNAVTNRSASRRFFCCCCTSWHMCTLHSNSLSSNDWLCSAVNPLRGSDVCAHNDCSISTRSPSFCFFSLQHTQLLQHQRLPLKALSTQPKRQQLSLQSKPFNVIYSPSISKNVSTNNTH